MDGQSTAVEDGSVHRALFVCGSGDRAASGAGSLFHNVRWRETALYATDKGEGGVCTPNATPLCKLVRAARAG